MGPYVSSLLRGASRGHFLLTSLTSGHTYSVGDVLHNRRGHILTIRSISSVAVKLSNTSAVSVTVSRVISNSVSCSRTHCRGTLNRGITRTWVTTHIYLIRCRRIKLGNGGHTRFRRVLVSGVGTTLTTFSIGTISQVSNCVLIAFGRRRTSRTTHIVHAIPNITHISLTCRAGHSPRRCYTTTIGTLHRFNSFSSFGIRTGHSGASCRLASVSVGQRINRILYRTFPSGGIRVRSPSTVIRILIIRNDICICTHSRHNINNLPINSTNGIIALLSSNVSSPITA